MTEVVKTMKLHIHVNEAEAKSLKELWSKAAFAEYAKKADESYV